MSRYPSSLFADLIVDEDQTESKLPPVVKHEMDNEVQFHLPRSSDIFLHSHNGGPFLPPATDQRGLTLTVYTSGTCFIQELKIGIGWYATIGRWGPRYFGAVVSWGVAIVLLACFRAIVTRCFEGGGEWLNPYAFVV